jgi:long-chain acyl-CoA synthetase
MNMRTFDDYVANMARQGNRLALTERNFLRIDRTTYAQLRERVARGANFLESLGVVRGDRVMIVAPNSPRWIELLLSTLSLGAVAVPVDAASSADVIARYAKQTTPKVIFGSKSVRLPDTDIPNYLVDDLVLLSMEFPATRPTTALQPSDPAVIVFTSGTTAEPKGVVLTQANILSNIEGILQRIDVKPEWRFLSVLPLSHMYEMSASLALMANGVSIFYMPRVTPKAIVESLNEYHITGMLAIPQLLSVMLERIQHAVEEQGKTKAFALLHRVAAHLPYRLRRIVFASVHKELGGHLDLVITGGAPIPPDVGGAWERMGVRTVQGYGLSETSPILTCNPLEGRRIDSAGRVLDNIAVRIGPDGEIQAKGPSIFSGYWQNEEATRNAFSDDGWFRTGDVGTLDDGWLHIQGRLKFVVVRSSGLKVFPEDVELVASHDPQLPAFCVVGEKSAKGESVVAVIASALSDEVLAQAIAHVNAQLEPFQHIDSWRRWPDVDFPRTRLLKIDRRRVEEWVNGTQAPVLAPAPDQVNVNDAVTNVIRLGLDEPNAVVTGTDRLDDLGLDSLRRLVVVALLEENFGVTIADDAVTPDTTVDDLRALVASSEPPAPTKRPPRWPYWPVVRVIGNAVRETLIRALVRIWVRSSVEGQENLNDLHEPALFIFNHSDDFDGPVVYHALPPRIRSKLAVAAGDDVLAEHRMLALLIRTCFAGFSFARSEPYMASLENVGTMIDRGWNVLIAPEGKISNSGELAPFKTGIGLLAVNLGAPVVAVKTIGLAGTVPLHAKWPKRRSRVTVRISAPVRFGPLEDYEVVTDSLFSLLKNL